MLSATSDKEDVKAALRKRFGSVFAFEDAAKLPRKSVSDFLRGRPNQNVATAINNALTPSAQSDLSDDSTARPDAHRLIAGVR
jgi:hypothetical protein